MPRVNFSIVVDGEVEFSRTFERHDAALDDFRPIWKGVVPEFRKIQREQFATEGAAGRSGKWKPLTPKYAAWKRRYYGNLPILQRTKRLFKALTTKTSDSVVEISKNELVLGTDIEYFKYHQRKGPRQRRVIDMSEAQLRRVQKTIQKLLFEEMRKGGIEYK